MVSEKGQVTIPKVLRERLGIRHGVVLDFEEREGQLIARKVTTEDPVDAVYGVLETPSRTDEIIEQLRGPAHPR